VTVTERYASVTVDEGTVEVASRLDDEMFEVRAGETVLMDAEEGSPLELVAPERADVSPSNREAQRVARNESARLERTLQRFERKLEEYLVDPDAGFEEPDDDEASLSVRLEDENELKPEAGEEDDSLSEDLLDEELRQGDREELDPNEDPDPGIDPDPADDPDPFIEPVDPDEVDPAGGDPGGTGNKNDLHRIDPEENESN
jgi:hypothetical protein